MLAGVVQLFNFNLQPAFGDIPEIENGTLKNWCRNELRNRDMKCSMRWVLKEEVPPPSKHPADLEPYLASSAFWNASCKRKFIEEHVCVHITEDAIFEIAESTLLQWDCPLFCQLRQYRITGCNIGFVIDAISRNSYCVLLFDKLLNRNKDQKQKKVLYYFSFLLMIDNCTLFAHCMFITTDTGRT